ncbi:molybdopterin-binding protein [Trinickia terrae]|uniref:Molybdopterin-binding protein n=1 Tax=Trinickia terrae TaxID=2571161 RepID=A0A4U1IA37_9BURK|nr:molybdopterin-dependent oxidoreductase [Trinickia terrae]TKC90359.1 molybdopterin-binding protein [Trinickia terrae]
MTNAALELAGHATDDALAVSGQVCRPLSLSLDDLRAFESIVAAPFDLRCFKTKRFVRGVGGYRGARLTDVIGAAGLLNESPTDFKRTVFMAVAHDGYAVTFSWHELFNTPVGERVLIAYECDGQPLGAEEGAPILFSGSDRHSAPRHVKRLARIVARVLVP